MAPGLVPSARHPGGCDDMLLSPSNPRAQCGENSVTRQTTSSTTHSVTGPSPSASMAANPANALSVSVPLMQCCAYLIYVYLPLHVNTLHICFCLEFSVLVPIVVSRVTTLTSTLCDCRHPSFASLDRLGPPSVGRRPHYSVPLAIEKGQEGCVLDAFPDTHPPSKQKTLMKR